MTYGAGFTVGDRVRPAPGMTSWLVPGAVGTVVAGPIVQVGDMLDVLLKVQWPDGSAYWHRSPELVPAAAASPEEAGYM